MRYRRFFHDASKNIGIPSSVISIGDSAFRDCSSLKSITIPSSVTSNLYYAFCLCYKLETIILEKKWKQLVIMHFGHALH